MHLAAQFLDLVGDVALAATLPMAQTLVSPPMITLKTWFSNAMTGRPDWIYVVFPGRSRSVSMKVYPPLVVLSI
jgi:hypothetical protein